MSPQSRSAPLARRLQAAKAEPTKPAALAPNPDLKPVAKPEPGHRPGRSRHPRRSWSRSRPRRPPRSRPGRSRHPRLNQRLRARLGREAPSLDPRAVLVRDFDWKRCPRPRSASPTCRRESRAAWGPSPTRTPTTTGGRPWHCGRSAARFRGAMIGRWMTRLVVPGRPDARGPDGRLAALRPDPLRASRRMTEIYQVVYRVWERSRVEIGEYLAALLDAES